ncbi:MAG: ribonuclease HI [Spirochaetaceae bacterium]|nr:ribonuclease HI [Spirochaetaceae bacterium]
MDKKNRIDIYTDGGCSGNPGPGGWGFVIVYSEKIYKSSGSEKDTTNNKMELTAVIKALESYKNSLENKASKNQKVRIFTDSIYVKNGITTWIITWLKNGWKTADKKDVKNKELWMILKNLSDRINPEWEWVKGHSGDRWNEECDALVKKEINAANKKI